MDQSVETRAIDAMLQRGVKIELPERTLLRYLGKKTQSFTIRQSYLGTLYEISRIALKLDYSEKILEVPFTESKQLVVKHVRNMAMIAAIAILNSKWKIRLFSRFLARQLLWSLTPEKLSRLAIVVMQMNNIQDFINSIRLMSAIRLTAPKRDLSPEDNGG